MQDRIPSKSLTEIVEETGISYERLRNEIEGRQRLSAEVLVLTVGRLTLLERLFVATVLIGSWGLAPIATPSTVGHLPRVLQDDPEEGKDT